jgi:hypothetical protein
MITLIHELRVLTKSLNYFNIKVPLQTKAGDSVIPTGVSHSAFELQHQPPSTRGNHDTGETLGWKLKVDLTNAVSKISSDCDTWDSLENIIKENMKNIPNIIKLNL